MFKLISRGGAGFVFGAALTASRVYVPSVIISQMQLKDFHMLVAFLCASACSALVMATFERLDIAKRQPQQNSSIGWFGAYDANVVGGALIGVGMATTGACPGTVIVQVATGVKSGFYVALGGFLGGILYARWGRLLHKHSLASSVSPSETKADAATVERQHTVCAKYSLDASQVLFAYEVMCLAIIGISALFGIDKNSPWLNPILGGTLIGAAQASTILLTGSPVGVSAAYGEAGEYFWRLVSPKRSQEARPRVTAIIFALGIFAGAMAMAQFIPSAVKASSVSPTKAVVGGCMMIIGARLAGGCTSGHGISGMSSFSISSIVTVAAMFGAGIATAMMIS